MSTAGPGCAGRWMAWSGCCRSLSALLSLLLIACGGVRLESGQRDRPIAVDGKADEWRDSLTVIKDAKIAVGLFDDQENLYVCISSWNDDVNLQALNLGLTVWFNSGGAEEKKFGIEYPLVEDRIQSPDHRGALGDVVPLPEASARPSNRLAIRGPGLYERHAMAVSDAPGLEVMASSVNGTFVYELKVPLGKSAERPYAIGARPGESIGILLETTRSPAFAQESRDSAAPRAGGRGGGRGGGMGGGMGGHRHGGTGGGMRGGGASTRETGLESPRIPKPLKVAAKIRLAAVDSPPGE